MIFEKYLLHEEDWTRVQSDETRVVAYGFIEYEGFIPQDEPFITRFGFVFTPATRWFGRKDQFFRGPAEYNTRT